jgi:hypothetical protein
MRLTIHGVTNPLSDRTVLRVLKALSVIHQQAARNADYGGCE